MKLPNQVDVPQDDTGCTTSAARVCFRRVDRLPDPAPNQGRRGTTGSGVAVETESGLARGGLWSAMLFRALVVGRMRRQSRLAEPECQVEVVCQAEVGSQGCLGPRVCCHV